MRYRLTHRLLTEVLLRSISCKGNSVKLINYSDIYNLSERLTKSKSLVNIKYYFQMKMKCYTLHKKIIVSHSKLYLLYYCNLK